MISGQMLVAQPEVWKSWESASIWVIPASLCLELD